MGDANTRYFHKVENDRKAHNGITGLFCDGRWVEEPELVKKLVVKYLRELFQGESWSRPKPDGVTFTQITKEQQEWLERLFSVEEIEEGLKSCEGNKALGPDGFNFNFIKFVWSSLKKDFVSFFEEFHQRGRLGFGIKWRGWIKEYLATARVSVLKAEMEGLLHGIEVGKKGLAVSLLQFADDTVILGRADSQNVFMVKSILRWFELMFGLRINFSKSSVNGLNVLETWLKGAATAFSCGVEEFPFIYLGMPVGGNLRNKKLWSPVVKKFHAKLAIWKFAVLSFGGRLILLNSVVRDKYYGGKEVVDITAVDTWERMGRERDDEELLMKLLGKGQLCRLVWCNLVPSKRNAIVFQNNGSFKEKLLDMVKIKSFSWIKSKNIGSMFSFYEWMDDPVACALEVRRHKKELKMYLKLKQGHI
ncbi:hypothetical protein SLEP1_g45073 [Rubroshorea leprosula]|uniref:Reverse transcriptase domain-containing protein n=1 Tax=Rubroshorea leprosula TaxID=152421 RepID=A0AAV5LJY4_9ROSI|nr:hypothetical protein SLEP1_g45073 [Rubroshorea leprosula]